MMYMCVIKVPNTGFFLLLTDEHQIVSYPTIERGLAAFTTLYARHQRASYEAAMSSVINWMYFQPAIVEAPAIDDVRSWLRDAEPRPTACTCMAGSFVGLALAPEHGQRLWDAGAKPTVTQSRA